MPKKAKIDVAAFQELQAYFHDVEGPLFRLGVALGRYFKENDEVRARFIDLEKLFDGYVKDAKPQIAEIARKRN